MVTVVRKNKDHVYGQLYYLVIVYSLHYSLSVLSVKYYYCDQIQDEMDATSGTQETEHKCMQELDWEKTSWKKTTCKTAAEMGEH